jgi:hypothetical protein
MISEIILKQSLKEFEQTQYELSQKIVDPTISDDDKKIYNKQLLATNILITSLIKYSQLYIVINKKDNIIESAKKVKKLI